jgi:hypothetical protein
VGSGSGATSGKTLEGKSEKQWNLMCSAMLSFIYAAGDSMMICFPRKRSLSVSTTRAIWTRNREAKKLEI